LGETKVAFPGTVREAAAKGLAEACEDVTDSASDDVDVLEDAAGVAVSVLTIVGVGVTVTVSVNSVCAWATHILETLMVHTSVITMSKRSSGEIQNFFMLSLFLYLDISACNITLNKLELV
jgi:hypothetical protein